MSEKWKEVRGFSGYKVSDLGRVMGVRNKSGDKIRRQPLSVCGYPQVFLCLRGKSHTKRVHRLVATAFVPGWFEGAEVNHKDGNKLNNIGYLLSFLTSCFMPESAARPTCI